MSRTTISTFQLFELFPDEDAARKYLEDRLWPSGPKCPTCKSGERLTTRKKGFHRCNACQLDFTIRTGTIFGRSHIPLHKWVHAMYLLVTARKGISSLQLAKQIGISQHAAWFMLQRLREACSTPDSQDKLKGVIEIHANVEVGSQLYTDDHMVFGGLDGLFFRHESVNHALGEYARGAASTNSIESVWAVLKRGIFGVYHSASPKHLGRYVDEFAFRLNQGNVRRHTLARLDSLIDAVVGKRITYKQVTA
jgi:transposase-like protein